MSLSGQLGQLETDKFVEDGAGNVALRVTVTGGSASSSQYEDGTTLVAGLEGNIMLGTDGTDLQFLSCNSIGVQDVTTALEGQTILKKTVDFTAAQTAQTIIDPTAGKKFVITSYIISCTTAGLITIFDETDDVTNRLAKHDLSANTSGNIVFPGPTPSSTADNKLEYTTGTAVGYMTVYYYEI